MTDAIRDGNHIPVALGVSSTDSISTLPFMINEETGGLVVDLAASLSGPLSSTDNSVPRFNGTDGSALQDSSAIIDDSGNLTANNITGTNTGDQNLFSTVAVGGQSSVIADSTADTLTFVAGTNITLTTDVSTDSVTITAGNAGLAPLFDHFTDVGNVTTGETDLYSDTITAAKLATNGDKIGAEYGGVYVSSGTATRQIRIYFGGTMIFDTGALTLSLSAAWTSYVSLIRVSASIVRYMISFTTEGAALAAYTATGEVTGLTLANTQVLKITGQAGGVGAATNDIVAKLGSVVYIPHA